MARSKPSKQKPAPSKPTNKPKRAQMGIGDFEQDQFDANKNSPPSKAPKPPKPNPEPAQGSDGPTSDSVAKEGAELGGGDPLGMHAGLR